MTKKLKKYKVVYKSKYSYRLTALEVEAASKSEAVLLFVRTKHFYTIESVERVKDD